jgi:hypothetical protein
MTITFETKVWENDWELMLKSSRLEKMIERCNHAFNQKILYIKGIATLKNNNNVKVFNLTWNREYSSAKSESKYDDTLNAYGFGFSDQMYLIRSADFRQPIYQYYDPASERYPKYGGELFEKRVDSWMRQNNFLRATYKNGSYLHKNFPKNRLLKKIQMWLP